ncbi:hypothetical protein ABF87_04890 [Nitrosomonas sp. JL21]|uniref:hypothetical protein n=1 Tax=Nitrosomonas sp. JL21 TaxID=153949 RepID=UPI00137186B7|nr:hypothetical protein [Nitrosomonas sp. JL21]MBL8496424.1 hypothetical protein [Nitrosomonas sp.]MCC7092151.1 hypothetical protein [Nitrosomonas sp.]MXS77304.1 hypothetical protein [Nitrosomonas sp. JL21]
MYHKFKEFRVSADVMHQSSIETVARHHGCKRCIQSCPSRPDSVSIPGYRASAIDRLSGKFLHSDKKIT